ncbi:hypothetical protein EN745_04745 [Mesorhizobium sp. M4A.F.Ca.ET.022.05.2.1]|uniref:hypothetical protein n=1 Tax=unclassified Mesorhizobium TaxID=325217 RepID=UPI000FCA7684|nr:MULTISPECIES: hypothetical protein [unclassified Mesorhizobium]RVC83028.1 hypothetical protein EN745_04745 [Mesorhizobium sp. M4A.F.Ca.ET.022.05.2.1]RWC94749.1 MAG: hypothetical protein EOS32_15625 [Mesorhizobium sp.]
MPSASFLRRRKRLYDKRPRSLIVVRTNAPRSNSKVVFIGHAAILQRGKEDTDSKSWAFDAHCAE